MEINKRIKLIRKKERLSQEKFGNKLGVSRDVISNIEYERVDAKPLLINHICNTYNINKNWLLTGEGEIYNIPEDKMLLTKALAEISLTENNDIKEIAQKLTKLDSKYIEPLNKLIDGLINNKSED